MIRHGGTIAPGNIPEGYLRVSRRRRGVFPREIPATTHRRFHDTSAAFPFLVVGEPRPHLRSVVRLLHRAAATCDFLTTNPRLRPRGPVRSVLRRGVGP